MQQWQMPHQAAALRAAVWAAAAAKVNGSLEDKNSAIRSFHHLPFFLSYINTILIKE
jgi:hypothetical protein